MPRWPRQVREAVAAITGETDGDVADFFMSVSLGRGWRFASCWAEFSTRGRACAVPVDSRCECGSCYLRTGATLVSVWQMSIVAVVGWPTMPRIDPRTPTVPGCVAGAARVEVELGVWAAVPVQSKTAKGKILAGRTAMRLGS